jgi:hypothetical protein
LSGRCFPTFQWCLRPPSSGRWVVRCDDEGTNHLWNVYKLLPDYTAQQPTRQPSYTFRFLAVVRSGMRRSTVLFLTRGYRDKATCTYIHTYIPWIQNLVMLTVGCGISHKLQNVQLSSVFTTLRLIQNWSFIDKNVSNWQQLVICNLKQRLATDWGSILFTCAANFSFLASVFRTAHGPVNPQCVTRIHSIIDQ